MSNCAIVGINWGDEGKGRMVDLLTQNYDVVVRYQGGGNAGHTVMNEQGKFALHLLPSGIFRQGVVNILGNGVAVDCESLWTEMQDVIAKGVPITGPGTGSWTAWRSSALRIRSTAPPSRASLLSTPTNTRKRPLWPESCCIRKSCGSIWKAF